MKLIFKTTIAILILTSLSNKSFGQFEKVIKKIDSLVADKDLCLGLALYDFQTGQSIYRNPEKAFPMLSVYKFPIAIAILNEVDKGQHNLGQLIKLSADNLLPNTWSPIRKEHQIGSEITLSELIRYTVVQSDNNGCDIILSLIGGPSRADKYLKDNNIANIHIRNTEEQMHQNPNYIYDNTSTPEAMLSLLKIFYNKEILKPKTNNYLYDIMINTSTGSIKKYLPNKISVAHKTGYSGIGKDHRIAALNDVGIIELSSEKSIAYVIFISDSAQSPETNYEIISKIGYYLVSIPLENTDSGI